MIIFLNRNGETVTATAEESIGRGSVNASSVYIVAPFLSSCVVQLSFVLPDGTGLYGGIAGEEATATAILSVTAPEGYSVWKWDIDARVTKLAGTVCYTILVTDEHGARFTFSGTFNVNRGAPVTIMAPNPKQDGWSDEDWSALVTAISNADGNATAAETAKNAAETAKTEAEAAKTAAESAQTAAETAKTEAETAKNAAETAKTEAEAAKTAAQGHANSASLASTDAYHSYEEAETAKNDAISAKTAAEAAQVAAEKAAEETASVADIVQTTGQSIAKVMSQKATTDALKVKIDKPEVAPTVGTVLKVTAVNDDGTFTCAWAEESGGGISGVKIDGQLLSIDTEGNVEIPKGDTNIYGVYKIQNDYGHKLSNGFLTHTPSTNLNIDQRNGEYRPISAKSIDYAVKAAMCDGKGAAWTDAEKAAARSRMGVTNGSTGKRFSFALFAIPENAVSLYTRDSKTLCRMTKANFLTLAPSCTDETYERMLQGALVTQNDGGGAAVSGTLITYPPRYVGVGIRLSPGYDASVLFDVMGDRRIAFFPDFETGHESDIYFMFDSSSMKPIIDIIVY